MPTKSHLLLSTDSTSSNGGTSWNTSIVATGQPDPVGMTAPINASNSGPFVVWQQNNSPQNLVFGGVVVSPPSTPMPLTQDVQSTTYSGHIGYAVNNFHWTQTPSISSCVLNQGSPCGAGTRMSINQQWTPLPMLSYPRLASFRLN